MIKVRALSPLSYRLKWQCKSDCTDKEDRKTRGFLSIQCEYDALQLLLINRKAISPEIIRILHGITTRSIGGITFQSHIHALCLVTQKILTN